MRSAIRPLLLLCALVVALVLTPPGRQLVQDGLDRLDRRPVQTILIIGNSRTYAHQMPDMVRSIADSAHSAVRLSITTLAWGGASFEGNWKSPDVQSALRRRWDHVILQPESRAPANDQNRQSFATYGEKLVLAAQLGGSPTALVVNWGYGETLYVGAPPGDTRDRYIDAIRDSTMALAAQTGAKSIDTSRVWEKVHAENPSLPLYEDGNHPTVYGSYLSALMIYGFISGCDVRTVTFRPPGVDEQSARLIRNNVAQYYNAEAS